MVTVTNNNHISPLAAMGTKAQEPQKTQETAGFKEILMNMGQEALAASREADFAASAKGMETMTQLDRANALNEASLSLEEFKRSLEAAMTALKQIEATQL